MQKYGNGRDEPDVTAFAIGPSSITLEFAGGDRYLYTDESVGPATISTMQVLAKAGRGLSAFISTDLRGRYSSKLAESKPSEVSGPTAAGTGGLTTVLVDSALIERALTATGMRTSREVVERGLRIMLQWQAQEELRQMQGTVTWVGDLDAMRADK
jgi:Arc/MetJ family transcription regulator